MNNYVREIENRQELLMLQSGVVGCVVVGENSIIRSEGKMIEGL